MIRVIMKTVKTILALSMLLLLAAGCQGEEEYDTFEFTTGDEALENTITYTDMNIDLVGELCLEANDELIPAQSERISMYMVRVWWRATQAAGELVEYTIRPDADCVEQRYSWNSVGDQSVQLEYNGTPLIQYEHPVFDYDNIEETKKPFHHVFSPRTGEFITKGPGGLYSHHRGIFFGYNKVEIAGRELDIWHANDGERSEHTDFTAEFSGPVFGGHVVQIDWKDHDGEKMLEERRDVRAFQHTDGSFVVDFHSNLFATAAPVRLGGDLQHAGVQFRAAQYVADNSESTRFIRPGDWAHIPADEELEEEDRINLPWNAMQFELEDGTYTVVYMSHPSNPGRNTEMSERKYGRFGEFFPYQQSEGAPVVYRYRFWIIPGEAPAVGEIDEMYRVYSR